jgi:predicted nuclease with TOPRIM domain
VTVIDLSAELLTQIRDGVHQLRADLVDRLDQTNARLDQTNARLGGLERSAATLTGHVGTLADRGLRLEENVADLRRRVEVLESPHDD